MSTEPLRVGSLVYSTDQGLGILAKSFYDHGVLNRVCVVLHSSRTNQPERFPGAELVEGRRTPESWQAVLRLLEGIDVFLAFETPFYWEILPEAKRRGIKVVMMPMYECMPVEIPWESSIDRYLCPSLLDLQYYPPPKGVFLPVPVEVPHRQRYNALTFVHNAGNGGLRSRNGTGELLDAMKYVKAPIRLLLRSQKPLQWSVEDPRIEYRVGTIPAGELWKDGDVFVFPEKFNGLSLPLQEAHASGLLVICGNRFPMSTWLPSAPLIPVSGYRKERVSGRCNEFDEAILDPKDVAAIIDKWYGKDISTYSLSGKLFGVSVI